MKNKILNFDAYFECEEWKLKQMKMTTKPNSPDEQQHIGNRKWKYNIITKKYDDLSPSEVDDKIKAIEDFEETNELFISKKEFKNKDLNVLKSEIDSSFRELSSTKFDRIKGDKYDTREPSIEEVIRNIENVISKYK